MLHSSKKNQTSHTHRKAPSLISSQVRLVFSPEGHMRKRLYRFCLTRANSSVLVTQQEGWPLRKSNRHLNTFLKRFNHIRLLSLSINLRPPCKLVVSPNALMQHADCRNVTTTLLLHLYFESFYSNIVSHSYLISM